MAFQILDVDGQAIDIEELDKQAAAFWGKEVDVKDYATPFTCPPNLDLKQRFDFLRTNRNWFDTIGLSIHLYKHESWQQYRDHFIEQMNADKAAGEPRYTYDEVVSHSDTANAEEALIAWWEAKGYMPHYVED